MAIPPGNKLIGQVGITFAANYTAENITPVALKSATALAVVKSNAELPPVRPVGYANIGAVGVTFIANKAEVVTVTNTVALAVVQYRPPTDFILKQELSIAVVKDANIPDNVVPPRPAQIGAVSLDVHSFDEVQPGVTLLQCIGLAVVKYHTPYKITTLIDIEYGADAELNIGDNS